MARQTLALDASVGVKWFSPKDEDALRQSLAIRDAHISEQIMLTVPDLFFYEVTNALVNKKFFSASMLQTAGSALFALGMSIISIDDTLLEESVRLARQSGITVYDACYAAIAIRQKCPLVTANPRHQKRELGCRIIPIEEWKDDIPDYL